MNIMNLQKNLPSKSFCESLPLGWFPTPMSTPNPRQVAKSTDNDTDQSSRMAPMITMNLLCSLRHLLYKEIAE